MAADQEPEVLVGMGGVVVFFVLILVAPSLKVEK